ncbi:DEAD/DEAH box helicase family protein [Kitasatospora sp. NBC_01266]|uniref:DEAD/DEAH box helicase family protein n=1 Tax=Kitasatospora sp. NBC_01266 TaxID=2903572 RepID=UPI002E35E2BF|nr:DEAD/DEAH box helicase family protein [Kitasatospora sp. NBC_01266]
MGAGESWDSVVECTANFSYLQEQYRELLWLSVRAELLVYTDPGEAVRSARRCAELVGPILLTWLGSPMPSQNRTTTQLLGATGLLAPVIATALTELDSLDDATGDPKLGVNSSLKALRCCRQITAWAVEVVTGKRVDGVFVPPEIPDETDHLAAVHAKEARESFLDHGVTTLAAVQERCDLQDLRVELASAAEQALSVRSGGLLALESLAQEFEQRVVALRQRANEPPEVPSAEREEILRRAGRAAMPALGPTQLAVFAEHQLQLAGWEVQESGRHNITMPDGSAVRWPRPAASGAQRYLLYTDGLLIGALIAAPSSGIRALEQEMQVLRAELTSKEILQAENQDEPLTFGYLLTGAQTGFVNRLETHAASREIFSVHRPQTLLRWWRAADEAPDSPTLLSQMQRFPQDIDPSLREAQKEAMRGLERSLVAGDRRALVQMAPATGKTRLAAAFSYRLLKHSKAKRVLFLVDRVNLSDQALAAFTGYPLPDGQGVFGAAYPTDRLTAAGFPESASVVVSTIQRLHALLRAGGAPVQPGQEPDPRQSGHLEQSEDAEALLVYPVQVRYNAQLPPESFDLIIVDECHRSIYGQWRPVLEYFDAPIVGLTATPVRQTYGFFRQNVVAEYSSEEAVADGVNVDFDVYRIRTEITRSGASLESGLVIPIRDRLTGQERYEQLEADFEYPGSVIGRSVIPQDQIRLVLRTFRDRLFTEIFPGRSTVPKTLIFAKSETHAEEITKQVREVFGRGNDFATKITSAVRAEGGDPQERLQRFRNSPELRIAVTVDMIATGTDVPALECVLFMREVRSAAYFEQMKGRGARTIDAEQFQAVTPDATAKERFVIVDAAGIMDADLEELVPMSRSRSATLPDLLRRTDPLDLGIDEAFTLASRLSRLSRQLSSADHQELRSLIPEQRGVQELTGHLVRALKPAAVAAARKQGEGAVRALVAKAVEPFSSNARLRDRIGEILKAFQVRVDEVNRDELLHAAGVPRQLPTDEEIIARWKAYLAEDDGGIAVRALIRGDNGVAPSEALRELSVRVGRPPHLLDADLLYAAYHRLGRAPEPPTRTSTTDFIPLARFELGLDMELHSYRHGVNRRFAAWQVKQEAAGRRFGIQEMWWLTRIRDTVVVGAGVGVDDLELTPFTARGGLEGFIDVFGPDAGSLLADLNLSLSL